MTQGEEADTSPTCFIAMPITTHASEAERYRDLDHWSHVMEHLFVPAIEAAGFEAVRPITQGSAMIHAQIIENLLGCDMVLCDLTSHNPNVIFELGVRTSLDKPIAIVRDEHTSIPFDLGGLNAHHYKPDLRTWSVAEQVEALAEHIRKAEQSCAGHNPMWQQYGLTTKANAPVVDESPGEAKLDFIVTQLEALREARLHPDSWTQTPSARTSVGRPPGLHRQVDADGFEREISRSLLHLGVGLPGSCQVTRLGPGDDYDFELVFNQEPQAIAIRELEQTAREYGVSVTYKVSDPMRALRGF